MENKKEFKGDEALHCVTACSNYPNCSCGDDLSKFVWDKNNQKWIGGICNLCHQADGHDLDCVNNPNQRSMNSEYNLLELFAGSRCIGEAGEQLGMNVFSIDWESYDKIDLSMDIEFLQASNVPFVPNHVHASFDCTTYTIAAIKTHRRNTIEPFSEYAKKCDRVNQNVISLIKYWLTINPKMTFTFENPRGALRHMPFMQEFKRHTVWYCQYGDDRAKPTDIWTNIESWVPKPMCRNFKYDYDGNIIDRHCHHESARRGAKTGTQGKKGSYERSKIPMELCTEILQSAINQL